MIFPMSQVSQILVEVVDCERWSDKSPRIIDRGTILHGLLAGKIDMHSQLDNDDRL